jgi:hypothetical protein
MERLPPDVLNYILSEVLDIKDLQSLMSSSKTLNRKMDLTHKINQVRKYIRENKNQIQTLSDYANFLLVILEIMNPNQTYRVVEDFEYHVYGENEGLITIKIYENQKKRPIVYMTVTEHEGVEFEEAPRWFEKLFYETGLYRYAKEFIQEINQI